MTGDVNGDHTLRIWLSVPGQGLGWTRQSLRQARVREITDFFAFDGLQVGSRSRRAHQRLRRCRCRRWVSQASVGGLREGVDEFPSLAELLAFRVTGGAKVGTTQADRDGDHLADCSARRPESGGHHRWLNLTARPSLSLPTSSGSSSTGS